MWSRQLHVRHTLYLLSLYYSLSLSFYCNNLHLGTTLIQLQWNRNKSPNNFVIIWITYNLHSLTRVLSPCPPNMLSLVLLPFGPNQGRLSFSPFYQQFQFITTLDCPGKLLSGTEANKCEVRMFRQIELISVKTYKVREDPVGWLVDFIRLVSGSESCSNVHQT